MGNYLTRTLTVAAVGAGLSLAMSTGTASAVQSSSADTSTQVSARAKTCSIPTVRYGSSGYYVYAFQKIYNRQKSYMAPRIATDGSFGPGTVSAARGMQYKYNLSIDGVVGPRTWAAITKGTCNVRKYM